MFVLVLSSFESLFQSWPALTIVTERSGVVDHSLHPRMLGSLLDTLISGY